MLRETLGDFHLLLPDSRLRSSDPTGNLDTVYILVFLCRTANAEIFPSSKSLLHTFHAVLPIKIYENHPLALKTIKLFFQN
jgi:hypothetical protein